MKGSYLGPAVHARARSSTYLTSVGAVYERVAEAGAASSGWRSIWPTRRSSAGSTAAWSSGRASLGARSILGDPRSPRMQAQMNLKIKFREGFRPFAPSVLRERVSDYFELDADSPYMLLVAPVKKERRIPLTAAQHELWGIDKLNVPRSDIPAVTHIDYSARVQTVTPETNRPLLRPDQGVRAAHRLRGAGEHVVQRARRADRVHARGRVSLLHADGHRRAGARAVRAREGGAAGHGRRPRHGSRNSSSTDARAGAPLRADRRRRVPRPRRDRHVAWRRHRHQRVRRARRRRWRSRAWSCRRSSARSNAPGCSWPTRSRR